MPDSYLCGQFCCLHSKLNKNFKADVALTSAFLYRRADERKMSAKLDKSVQHIRQVGEGRPVASDIILELLLGDHACFACQIHIEYEHILQ